MTSAHDDRIQSEHFLGKLTRIYLHGFIAFAVLLAIAYIVNQLLPVFDITGNRFVAFVLSLLAIVIVPPLAGSLILYGLFPLLGKHDSWRGILGWDDRLLSEVSSAKEKTQVVIIRWPSDKVRTMGILTSTFQSQNSEKQLAAVYVSTAPQTKFGYIRVVELADVEFTDWTIRQWQLYQFTFGAASPDQLRDTSSD